MVYKFRFTMRFVSVSLGSLTSKMKTIILLASVVTGFVVAGHHGGGREGQDNVHYKFEYGVYDPHTHDHKTHHEHRDGKHVTGGYTLKEADGTHRIVKYKSGPHKGFEAVVERRGHAQHPAHYGKHGHEHGGKGGTSYVGVTHWSNQGSGGHGHGHGGHGGQGGQSRHGGQGGHGGQGRHGGQGGHGHASAGHGHASAGHGHGYGGHGQGGEGGHYGHEHGHVHSSDREHGH